MELETTLEGVLSSAVLFPSSTDHVLDERSPQTTRIPVAIREMMDTAMFLIIDSNFIDCVEM